MNCHLVQCAQASTYLIKSISLSPAGLLRLKSAVEVDQISTYKHCLFMPHIIEPLTNVSFHDAIRDLRDAHGFVVARAKQALVEADSNPAYWGIFMKRISVNLTAESRPRLIGKSSEKLGEVVNIAATVERLLAAIEWFSIEYPSYSILECHPSTSDESSGNDLVRVDSNGTIAVRCEVCDVASSSAGSNGKERKDIRNLGCETEVPDDNVRRYICTAPEFATALMSAKRKWFTRPYRYEQVKLGDAADCRLLLVRSNDT